MDDKEPGKVNERLDKRSQNDLVILRLVQGEPLSHRGNLMLTSDHFDCYYNNGLSAVEVTYSQPLKPLK